MKIAVAKRYVSAMAVAALVLGAGAVYTVTTVSQEGRTAYAYTSAENTQDPATAQDDYVVTIPDANLRKALNKVIATATSTPRTDTQAITAGEMRAVTGATADFNETGAQNFLSRSGIKNLEGIQFLTNAETINLGVNLLSDENALRPLSSLTQLKRLNLFHAFRTGDPAFTPPVNILAPIKDLPALEALHLNTNKLTPEHLAALKDTPKLKTLLIAGNNILNLNDLFKGGGFAALDQTSTFSSQKHEMTLNKDQAVFANPVRDYNGAIVPITETATVKNVDAAGQPNRAGGHIKLVDTYDKDKVDIRWSTPAIDPARFGAQAFSGTITVTYDLPPRDTEAPVFTPAAPAKIVSRKGVALTLTDVTAHDAGSGLSPAGVTYNHIDIGLNPTNPAKGVYVLTYTAEDNLGNRATVTRDIEITDADALQQKVDTSADSLFDGYTTESRQLVKDKRAAAEAVIARNDAPQSEIDQALAELEDAISKLKVDVRKLEAAAGKYNAEPGYIQQDPAVQAALAEANRVLNAPDKTPASVDQAARSLIKALDDAKQAEQQRQVAAADTISAAKQPGTQTPGAFNAAQDKIDEVKDPAKKAELQNELDGLKAAYNTKLTELRDLITQASDPATVDGMTEATKQQLQQAVANAQGPVTQGTADQAVYDTLLGQLRQAIDDLRADKQPLVDAEAEYDAQPEYVKANPAVAAAFRKAEGTRAMANPPVRQVRDDAQALRDAIAAALRTEPERQVGEQKASPAQDERLSDTGMNVAAPIIGGLGALAAGAWAIIRRKK